jgi:hypothetical protein
VAQSDQHRLGSSNISQEFHNASYQTIPVYTDCGLSPPPQWTVKSTARTETCAFTLPSHDQVFIHGHLLANR